MTLDRPGDLSSYSLKTRHAAIRGFHYYQRVEPYHSNFMRMIVDLSRNRKFVTYPLATHLTHNWLGGNLQISNQPPPPSTKLAPTQERLIRIYAFANRV